MFGKFDLDDLNVTDGVKPILLEHHAQNEIDRRPIGINAELSCP